MSPEGGAGGGPLLGPDGPSDPGSGLAAFRSSGERGGSGYVTAAVDQLGSPVDGPCSPRPRPSCPRPLQPLHCQHSRKETEVSPRVLHTAGYPPNYKLLRKGGASQDADSQISTAPHKPGPRGPSSRGAVLPHDPSGRTRSPAPMQPRCSQTAAEPSAGGGDRGLRGCPRAPGEGVCTASSDQPLSREAPHDDAGHLRTSLHSTEQNACPEAEEETEGAQVRAGRQAGVRLRSGGPSLQGRPLLGLAPASPCMSLPRAPPR